MSRRSYEAPEGGIMDLNSRNPSIFDLEPTEADFEDTLPLNEEMNAFLLSTRDMAGEITRRYDTKRKAEKEAKGQAWQNSRRGTKQATKDRRAAAEAPLRASYINRAFLELLKKPEVILPPDLPVVEEVGLGLVESLEPLLAAVPSPDEIDALLASQRTEHESLMESLTLEESNPVAWSKNQALALYRHMMTEESE